MTSQEGRGRSAGNWYKGEPRALQGDMKTPYIHPSHRNAEPLLNHSAPAGLNLVHSFGQYVPGISGFARLSAGHWGQREVPTSPVCKEYPVQGGYRPVITASRRQQMGRTVQTQRHWHPPFGGPPAAFS